MGYVARLNIHDGHEGSVVVADVDERVRGLESSKSGDG